MAARKHATCFSLIFKRKFLCRKFLAGTASRGFSLKVGIHKAFKFSELSVRLASPEQLHPKPDLDALQFGKDFTDHMLKIHYYGSLGGWQSPEIVPLENIVLHPAAKVLHYAIELFEGMKAYRGVDGRIRLFRPEMNMERMNTSALRAGLPTFDGKQLIKCLCRLVSIDQEWVPHSKSASLYIRPTLIGIDPSLGVASSESALLYTILSPVGPYFGNKIRPISLLADPKYTRAWPGGCGDKKLGSNYGPTIYVQQEALSKGHHQTLWLYGDDDYITEVGAMNIFIVYVNDEGERELLTPPLDGLVLPGITRASILDLSRQWNLFKVSETPVTMGRIRQLLKEKRMLEMFGSGTAAIVSPVSSVFYKDELLDIPTMEQKDSIFKMMLNTLTDIQYGYIEHPWSVAIDEF